MSMNFENREHFVKARERREQRKERHKSWNANDDDESLFMNDRKISTDFKSATCKKEWFSSERKKKCLPVF